MRRSHSKFNRARAIRPSILESLEARRLLSAVVVNTIADSTDAAGSSTVSLRDAIAIANKATSPTTITFSTTVFSAAKTITLGGTQLQLTNTKEATTIIGPTAILTISGNHKSRILDIPSNVTATIQNINFIDGTTSGSGVAGGGGGIRNAGTLTMTGGTVAGNTASTGGGGILNLSTMSLAGVTVSGNTSQTRHGGGIENYGGITTLATAMIINSTITGNFDNGPDGLGAGGGISTDSSGGSGKNSLTLENVTITGNKSLTSGGGIYEDSKTVNSKYINCTISNNSAGQGGGIENGSTAAVSIGNSIVAGNSASTGPDQNGSTVSLGHNLIGKTDGSTGWTSADYTGTIAKPLNAMLGTLASNAGPTQTLLPLAGSPAIDKGLNSLIPSGITTDQRGLPRIYNSTVDIGAVEVQPLIQMKSPGNQSAAQGISKSLSLGSFTQYTNATPFKDTINWGDGSTSTTLSLTAAGTISATAHTFAKAGTFTVTEVIADAKGNKSNTLTFTVTVSAAVGSISGLVFDDANGNARQDSGEFGLGLWTVYLDTNNNGQPDPGEKSLTTDINGKFSFTNLPANTYYVRVVPVNGATTTTAAGGVIKVVLSAGQVLTTAIFGEK